MHVHITCGDGEAKFWIEPIVGLARHAGLSQRQLGELQRVVEERRDEIANAWDRHFGARR